MPLLKLAALLAFFAPAIPAAAQSEAPETQSFSISAGAPGGLSAEYSRDHAGWEYRALGGYSLFMGGAGLEAAKILSDAPGSRVTVGPGAGYFFYQPLFGGGGYEGPYVSLGLRAEFFRWMIIGLDAGFTLNKPGYRAAYDSDTKGWAFLRWGWRHRFLAKPLPQERRRLGLQGERP